MAEFVSEDRFQVVGLWMRGQCQRGREGDGGIAGIEINVGIENLPASDTDFLFTHVKEVRSRKNGYPP
jgi:hypothetical protein